MLDSKTRKILKSTKQQAAKSLLSLKVKVQKAEKKKIPFSCETFCCLRLKTDSDKKKKKILKKIFLLRIPKPAFDQSQIVFKFPDILGKMETRSTLVLQIQKRQVKFLRHVMRKVG